MTPTPGASTPRFAASWREIAFATLVALYAGVSVVAWTDHPRTDAGPVLSDLERSGLNVWRSHNCQACHQLHGFGGFLGPDLTNLVDDSRDDEEFRKLLEEGSKQMPALHLPEEDQRAVLAFLRAMNRTGRSTPRPLAARRNVPPMEHWKRLSEEWERAGRPAPGERERRGRDLMTAAQCGACHVPFTPGIRRAPDLTARAQDRSPAVLAAVFRTGRGAMPAYEFGAEDTADIAAWLEWTARNRAALVELNEAMLDREGFSWRDVPWWEFR